MIDADRTFEHPYHEVRGDSRKFTWQLLDSSTIETRLERRLNHFLAILIVANVIAVVLESIQQLDTAYHSLFKAFEAFSIAIFLCEYFCRLWSCTASPRYHRPILGRLKYLLTPLAVVDFISIVPSLIPFFTYDLRVLRSIRLLRMFRLLKLARYQHSFLVIFRVFRQKREELLVTSMLMGLLILLSASLMFYAEHEIQPDKFSDIPTTFWWSVMTLTTVGYGDVYPVTGFGKLIAAIAAVLGIAFFALPTSILGAGFLEALQSKQERESICASCGCKIRKESDSFWLK